MKKLSLTVGLMAAIVVCTGTLVVTPASAAEAGETVTVEPTITQSSTAHSSLAYSDEESTVVTAKAEGKIELAYVMAQGYHPSVSSKSKKKKIAKCTSKTTSKQFADIVAGIQSGKYSTKVDLQVGCKADDTGIYPGSSKIQTFYNKLKKREWGYYDPKIKAIRRSICGNILRPHKSSTKMTYLQVNVTQYGKAKVSASLTGTKSYNFKMHAVAQGPNNKCYAEAWFNVTFTQKLTVSVSASATAKTISSVKASTKSSVKQKLITDIEANAKITLQQKLEFIGDANASCTYTVDTPPVVSPPTIVDLTQINDVDITNTTQVCATANVPESNSGTLTFAARFGSFSTTKTFNVSGQVEKCTTYQAPTEVPAGGTDTITVTVRDNVTGKSASDTTTFKIGNPVVPKDSAI